MLGAEVEAAIPANKEHDQVPWKSKFENLKIWKFDLLRLRPLRSSVQNQPVRPVRPVTLRIFGDFYQKDMRVAHLRMLTGVLKLDFWGSRKVAFTFGAFTSDICVRRVPCFDPLFRHFLRENVTFFPLALSTFQGEKL